MDRTFRKRALALLVVAISLFGWTGEALGTHACPHHSYIEGVHGAAAPEDAVHGAEHAHHAEAAHPTEDGSSADDDRSAPAEHPDHSTCTCQGGCPVTAGGALPAAREVQLPPVVLADRAAPTFAASPLVARLAPHVLPYGHAPPAAA